MRSSNGNLNIITVVSEYRDQLDEDGNAEHLYIHDGLTDEMRWRKM